MAGVVNQVMMILKKKVKKEKHEDENAGRKKVGPSLSNIL
jgi:hypothetical protein